MSPLILRLAIVCLPLAAIAVGLAAIWWPLAPLVVGLLVWFDISRKIK